MSQELQSIIALSLPAASLPQVNKSINKVALRTPHGEIRINLRPEWSESSVEYLRRLAASPELCSSQCQFYRAEPGFLLQVKTWKQAIWKSQLPRVLIAQGLFWALLIPLQGQILICFEFEWPPFYLNKSRARWGGTFSPMRRLHLGQSTWRGER